MAPAKEAGFSPSASLGIKKPALHGTALTTTDFAEWRDWRQVCVVISRRGHDISCPYAKKEKKDAALAGKNHRDANTRKGRRYEGKSKMAPLKTPASESRPYLGRAYNYRFCRVARLAASMCGDLAKRARYIVPILC